MAVETLGVPYHRTMLEHGYALINAMQVEPGARTDLPAYAIVPERYRAQPHLFPLLVELHALTDHQRIALLDRMSAWRAAHGTSYFSALLTSPDDTGTVLRHLVNRCDVKLPGGRFDVLRLHDPRVFQHLTWLLEPEQWTTLLANITRWSWPAADGRWHSVINADASLQRRLDRWELTTTQWATLFRLVDLQAVFATLKPATSSLAHDNALAQRIDAALAEAEAQLPKANAADRRLRAEHTLRFGPRLHRHPDYQTRFATVRAGQRGYFAAFAGLDDATLQAWATSTELAKECP